ncbi:hypothetical protein ACFL0U_03375, partial [Pseudomonadota bacterium]
SSIVSSQIKNNIVDNNSISIEKVSAGTFNVCVHNNKTSSGNDAAFMNVGNSVTLNSGCF